MLKLTDKKIISVKLKKTIKLISITMADNTFCSYFLLDDLHQNIKFFICVDALCSNQQFFSHVWTIFNFLG